MNRAVLSSKTFYSFLKEHCGVSTTLFMLATSCARVDPSRVCIKGCNIKFPSG